VTSINEFSRCRLITGRFGSMPTAQLLLKETQASPINLADCKTLAAISGLNTLSSKWPELPPTDTATSFPITWAHTIVIASGCVGLTLPGIMDDPGSLSGITISPMPQRGPELSILISLATFISDTAARFNAPESSTIASWAASDSNLFGAVTNG